VADPSLRIALLTYSTRPRGGVVHAIELAEALRGLGQDVRLFALEKPGRSQFFRPTSIPTSFIPVDDVAGEELDDRIARYIDAYVAFLEIDLARGERYDIYHAEDCISGNALVRLRQAGRIPFVVRTVHHVDDFTTPGLASCQLQSIVAPDAVLAVSRWWSDRLAAEHDVHAPVVHNGVDLQHHTPPSAAERAAARERLGLNGRVAILSVGGVEPRKNTRVLLEAFVRARSELADRTGLQPTLVIAGGASLFDHAEYRGAFDDDLLGYLADGRIEPDSVVKTGPIEEQHLIDLYAAADVLAFPSVREGWGLTVLEAQASGLPVVASDLDVLREYLVDGENALLVPPDDPEALARALVRVVTDRVLAATLREGGLATARRFDWRSSAERHLGLYRQLIARTWPGPEPGA
jgi:glycosyltransferase-like protein